MPGFLPRLFTALLPRVRPYQEMGVSGTPIYAGYALSPERSPKLIGQEKYRTFSTILANTSIVAAGVRYFLNIVAKPSWSCEPADESAEAKKYAEFVEDVIDDLHTPWSRIVRRCGTYRFHGFAIQEWTAKKRDDGKIGFHDIESRPQWTIWRWEVDERGTVTGCWQRDPLTGRELGLPRGKVMYLVDDTLTDSPEGMGLLRHCVEPATRLEEYHKQEGFGYLRDLHGVPLGRAPMDELAAAVRAGNIKQGDMDAAVEKLKQFCAMEKKTTDTAIVLNSQPYIDVTDSGNTVSSVMKWGVELINGGAPGLVPIGAAIVRLNTEMARILGVEHLLLGADAAGSYALAKEKATDLYLLANSVVNDIGLQAEHDLIWPLWSLNGFPDKMMPHLRHEDVQPKDAEQIGRVLRDMATAGAALQPDDEVQNFIRDLLGAPQVDLAKLQERLAEITTEQTAEQEGAGYGAGPGGGEKQQQKQPSGYQEDMQDRADARAAKMLAKARMAKRVVNELIRKSGNGHLPELQEIGDQLDDILKAWDESKHPRGEHGRFGSGGGVAEQHPLASAAWWHGTVDSLLDSIRKHGLLPPTQTGKVSSQGHRLYGRHISDYKSSVFMTSDYAIAKQYADSSEMVHALGLMGKEPATEDVKAVILRVRLTDEQKQRLVVDEGDEGDRLARDRARDAEIEFKHYAEARRQGKSFKEAARAAANAATKSPPTPKQFRLVGAIPPHQIDHFENGKWVQLAERLSKALGQHVFYAVIPIMPSGMAKVVPYAEARPYMDEDEFVAGRSGASDGPMRANPHFSERRRLKPSGPEPLVGEGSTFTTGGMPPSVAREVTAERSGHRFDDEAIVTGDAGTPGARMRTTGRRRTV